MCSSCGEFHLFNFENGKEEVNKHLETCKAKQKQEKKTKKVSLMTLRKHAESIFWSTPLPVPSAPRQNIEGNVDDIVYSFPSLYDV